MFCTNCGQQNLDNVKFCTNCGKPVSSTNTNIPQPATSKKRFEVSKLFFILLYILAGAIVLGAIGVGVTGQGESGMLIKTIVNWLLGIIFGIATLGLMGGVIAGIILIVKAGNEQADANYYKRNALWCFLGPVIIIVGIILGYVIINVVSNLVNPVPTIS